MNSKEIWGKKIKDFSAQLKAKGKGGEISPSIIHSQILAILSILQARNLTSEEEFYSVCIRQLDGISVEMYNQPILSVLPEDSTK